jgi:DNA-directed RNA polymerase sigma subunit (sigma70/sigma32)
MTESSRRPGAPWRTRSPARTIPGRLPPLSSRPDQIDKHGQSLPAPRPARSPSVPSERRPELPDALTKYLADLGQHPPISREEEHELAVRWAEESDVDAARQLVLSNLRLVVKIAMEYRRAWTNVLDLIQEGNVGLMQAVRRYDPYQGVKLSSYAVTTFASCVSERPEPSASSSSG